MKEIELVVTDDCNFKCNYCYVKQSKNYMSFGTMRSIFLTEYNFQPICFTFFGGEPLLNWDNIKRFIQSIRKIDIFIELKLVTNGYLLTKEILRFCKEENVMISLSYDGIYSQRFRGQELNHNLLTKHVKHIHKIISRNNYANLIEDVESIFNLGYDYISIDFDKDAEWYYEQESLAQVLSDLMIWCCDNPQKNIDLFYNVIKLGNTSSRKSCGAGITKFAYNHDGKKFECSKHIYSDKKLEFIIFTNDCCKKFNHYCEGICKYGDLDICIAKEIVIKLAKQLDRQLKDNEFWKQRIKL